MSSILRHNHTTIKKQYINHLQQCPAKSIIKSKLIAHRDSAQIRKFSIKVIFCPPVRLKGTYYYTLPSMLIKTD